MQGGVRARARARLRSRPTLREYASSWLPSVLDLAVRTLSPLPPHTQRATPVSPVIGRCTWYRPSAPSARLSVTLCR